MLVKVIKHIIEQEKTRKSYEKKSVWIVAKSYIHTPKPQIQDMEPKRAKLGARTLPCDCGKREESKVFRCVWETN